MDLVEFLVQYYAIENFRHASTHIVLSLFSYYSTISFVFNGCNVVLLFQSFN